MSSKSAKDYTDAYNEETGTDFSEYGKLQTATNMEESPIRRPNVLNQTKEGAHKLSNTSRSNQTTEKSFLCGKYKPQELCKKDFYLSESGDGKEWTRQMFEELRGSMGHMKFNVLLTFSNELLVQFTIDIYQFSKQKYEDLNKYMNNLILNGLGFNLGLRKRGDRWGRIEAINASNSPSTSLTPAGGSGGGANNSYQSDSMRKQSEPLKELSSKNNSSINNNISENTKIPKSELVHMCYSMYTPWVKDAVYNVHKAASQYDRLKVRQRANK